jgi:hypothetical protein
MLAGQGSRATLFRALRELIDAGRIDDGLASYTLIEAEK